MKTLLVLATVLTLSACDPVTYRVVTISAVEAYRFCQAHGLELAERYDDVSRIDSPRIVSALCAPS